MSSRRRNSLAAWIFATVVGGLIGACVFAPEDVSGPCKQDSDCPDDDMNPCTRGVCNPATGFCSHQNQDLPVGDTGCDDGNPCTSESCSEGQCVYTPQALPFGDKGCDDQNPCTDEYCSPMGECAHKDSTVAPDDGNECTTDACVGGVAMHTNIADGTACGLNDALECVSGKCACAMATECGVSTPCLKYDCTNGACASTSLEAGTFVDGQDPGDCFKHVCDGNNNIVSAPDVTDPPTDPISENCKKKACDADGNIIDVDDPTDAPKDDNNPCTNEGCNGGTAINHVPVADGTDCGAAPTCGPVSGGKYQATPHDKCMSGTCTQGAPVSCDLLKCDAGMTACLANCGGDVDCVAGAYCDSGNNSCKLQAGVGNPCANQGQCAGGTFCVDGVCCATQCGGLCEQCNQPGNEGLCVPVISGTDPANECTDPQQCNGSGGCGNPKGTPCTLDSQCLTGFCADGICCNSSCAGACYRCDVAGSNGTCSPVDANMQVTGCDTTQACDGSGNCKTLIALPCGNNGDCLSANCQDGVCCNSNCNGACARCDLMGTVGTCTNVPSGGQVANCNATQACDGMNNCKKVNGQTCGAVTDCVSGQCQDGYCCNSACTGACAVCNLAGSLGTCSNLGSGQQPNGCNGTQACDGSGGCKKANGQGCAANGDCASGFCVDGYCCNSLCAGTCQACSNVLTGSANGMCANIKDKTDPDNECMGVGCNTSNGNGCCNGMGACY